MDTAKVSLGPFAFQGLLLSVLFSLCSVGCTLVIPQVADRTFELPIRIDHFLDFDPEAHEHPIFTVQSLNFAYIGLIIQMPRDGIFS